MAKNYVLITAAGAIRFPSWENPGDRPRGLLPLNGETIVGRLVRQARACASVPIIGVGVLGKGNWESWHIDAFAAMGCELVTSEKMGTHNRNRQSLGTPRIMLEHVQRLGVKRGTRLMFAPGDYVFTDAVFRSVCVGYKAPCYYCLNKTDPAPILTGGTLPGYLEILRRYEGFTWKKIWFGYWGLWKKERAFLKSQGFRLLGVVRGKTVNDPTRFVEVDEPKDYELAKRLVAMEKGGVDESS